MKTDIAWILSTKLENLRIAVRKHMFEVADRTNMKLSKSLTRLDQAMLESQLSPDVEATIAVKGVGPQLRVKGSGKKAVDKKAII